VGRDRGSDGPGPDRLDLALGAATAAGEEGAERGGGGMDVDAALGVAAAGLARRPACD